MLFGLKNIHYKQRIELIIIYQTSSCKVDVGLDLTKKSSMMMIMISPSARSKACTV